MCRTSSENLNLYILTQVFSHFFPACFNNIPLWISLLHWHSQNEEQQKTIRFRMRVPCVTLAVKRGLMNSDTQTSFKRMNTILMSARPGDCELSISSAYPKLPHPTKWICFWLTLRGVPKLHHPTKRTPSSVLRTYLLMYVRSWALPEKMPNVQTFRKFPAIIRSPKVHHRVHS
jgi:hypothetical protein